MTDPIKTKGVKHQRKIVGFHTDEENHWVAELDCGHNQHVRHNPPLSYRPWVLTELGRKEKLGEILNCLKCQDSSNDFSSQN